jgi:hypothetical protein
MARAPSPSLLFLLFAPVIKARETLLQKVFRLALVSLFILSASTTVMAQQRILWQGRVRPEQMNVYTSASLSDRAAITLKQGDVVDVVLQINTMGVGWCQVSFSTQSEPLGYVLCLGLEQNGVAPNHLVHSEAVATESSATSSKPNPSVATVADSTVLTNEDILDMKKIGLPPEILVAKIKSSQTDFNTSPAQLKELKAEGLPDTVILAMVEAPASQATAAPNDLDSANHPETATAAREAPRSQPGPPMVHRKIMLEDNTPVHLVLSDNLSSASATTGQTISFEVSEDVLVDTLVIIPRGSLAWGTVTDAQAKRRLGRAGHLDVNIDKVRLADGEKVLLSATSHAKGASHTGAMTAGIVATSLVVWPAAPFFLFMHGHDVTIPKGTKIEAFINGNATLDAANFVSAPK